MKTSEAIDQLATALSAAQGEMKAAPKSGKNDILKNHYSTLGDVIEVARPVLAKHGLSYVQFPVSPGDLAYAMIGLTTRLMHTSGQWMEESVFFPLGDGNRGVTAVQVAGSTITYMRRYAVAAMLGIVADEDTDGNQPQQGRNQQQKTAQQKPPPPPVVSKNRVYNDGSPVDVKAVGTYDAYVAAHNGKAPENVHNLRNWYKSQNANGNPPAPQVAQDGLFDADDEAARQAALETAQNG